MRACSINVREPGAKGDGHFGGLHCAHGNSKLLPRRVGVFQSSNPHTESDTQLSKLQLTRGRCGKLQLCTPP